MQLFFLQRSQHAKFGLMVWIYDWHTVCLVIASYLQDQQVCTVDTSQNPAFLQFISMNLPVNYRKKREGYLPGFWKNDKWRFFTFILIIYPVQTFFWSDRFFSGYSLDHGFPTHEIQARRSFCFNNFGPPAEGYLAKLGRLFYSTKTPRRYVLFCPHYWKMAIASRRLSRPLHTTRSGIFIAETLWYVLKACTK